MQQLFAQEIRLQIELFRLSFFSPRKCQVVIVLVEIQLERLLDPVAPKRRIALACESRLSPASRLPTQSEPGNRDPRDCFCELPDSVSYQRTSSKYRRISRTVLSSKKLAASSALRAGTASKAHPQIQRIHRIGNHSLYQYEPRRRTACSGACVKPLSKSGIAASGSEAPRRLPQASRQCPWLSGLSSAAGPPRRSASRAENIEHTPVRDVCGHRRVIVPWAMRVQETEAVSPARDSPHCAENHDDRGDGRRQREPREDLAKETAPAPQSKANPMLAG